MQLPLRLSAALVAALALTLMITGSALAAAPANDNFADAQELTLGADPVPGTSLGGSTESGEPGSGSATIWYHADGPAVGSIEFTVCGSDPNHVLSANGYMGTPGSTLATIVDYQTAGGYRCQDPIRVGVTAGSRAFLQVDTGGETVDVSAQFIAAPTNDSFAAPTVLSGTWDELDFDTTNATWEPGEKAIIYDNGNLFYDARSLWYEWTAPDTGTLTMTACAPGSTVKPKITLYSGNALDTLAGTAISTGSTTCPPGSNGGTLFNEVTSGTTYRIRVTPIYSDLDKGPGHLQLQFAPSVTNDLVADAIDLGDDSTVSTSGSNWLASTTPESGEPAVFNGSQKPASVWYKWTAPTSGLFHFDMCRLRTNRANFVISVFTSSGGSSATPAQLQSITGAEADDNCSTRGNVNRAGWVDVSTTAGTTYWIAIALNTYNDAGSYGPFTLDIGPAGLDATSPPVISGRPFIGRSLSVSDGIWHGRTPISISYQWQRCDGDDCADISGATSSTYATGDDDLGKQLRVNVKASNSFTNTTVATGKVGPIYTDEDDDGVADDHGDVCPGVPGEAPKTNGCPVTDIAVTSNPSIGGSVTVGQTVSVASGSAQNTAVIDTTTPAPTAQTMIMSCSSPTETSSCEVRAGGSSYTLIAADAGRHIRARVIWSNGDVERVVWSDAAGPVTAATLPQVNPASIKLPKKLGTLKVKKGRLTVKQLRLRCLATATGRCTGSATLTGKVGKKKITLKLKKISAAPGKSATVTFKVSKKQLKLIRRTKKLKAQIKLTWRAPGFKARTAKPKLTVKA